MFERLMDLQRQVLEFAGRFDAAGLHSTQAETVVKTVARMKHALATVEVLAAARVAECGTWRQAGAASAADWLAKATGTTVSQARDRLATGEALTGGLDAAADMARSGGLSPEQAAAITDACSVNPTAEAELLTLAGRETVGTLRERCGQKKAEADPDPDATHRRIHGRRRLRRWTDTEGAAHRHWVSTVEDAAILDAAIDSIADELFHVARREGRIEPVEAYGADAVVELARRAVDAGGATSTRKVREKYLAIIRADLTPLVRGSLDAGEVCEIAGIGPIPVSRVRELLGDSILKLVLTRGRDANVTHLGRGANTAQKVALLWRSPTCEVEGCNRRARLEDDHLEPYAKVRETGLENLGRKCDHHHGLKSNDGWDSAVGDGRRPMVPPGDPRHPEYRPPSAA